MLKISGLDQIQRELKEAERALSELDGELGSVSFDPNDPASIESAIHSVNRIIDERAGEFSGNSIVGAGGAKQGLNRSLAQDWSVFS